MKMGNTKGVPITGRAMRLDGLFNVCSRYENVVVIGSPAEHRTHSHSRKITAAATKVIV